MNAIYNGVLRLDGEADPDGWVLLGNRCSACGVTFHPLRARCARCGSPDLEEVSLPKTGEIISYTQVHQASPGALVEPPYFLALIRLSDGTVIEAASAGSHKPANSNIPINSRVKLVLAALKDEEGQEVAAYFFTLNGQ